MLRDIKPKGTLPGNNQEILMQLWETWIYIHSMIEPDRLLLFMTTYGAEERSGFKQVQ